MPFVPSVQRVRGVGDLASLKKGIEGTLYAFFFRFAPFLAGGQVSPGIEKERADIRPVEGRRFPVAQRGTLENMSARPLISLH